MNDKKLLYIIISAILLIMLIIGNFRYNRVVKQLYKTKIENLEQVDSLVYINEQLKKEISTYKIEISDLENKIDSLKGVKNKILVKRDGVVVSKSVSEGIVKLQENLSK
ncbi:MAG: hypothetical protein IJ193_09635 [Bacilli bacterium]|nr:hypothetical protein [Bacilli bacterium]